MVIIARRRWLMGGTRYNARGIDDEGNVANFCELEHLVFNHTLYKDPVRISKGEHIVQKTTIKSYVQVRGSMPFFWDQKGVKTVLINRNLDTTMFAFKKHFADLRKDYNDGQILVINLITTHSSMEKGLLDHYESLLQTSGLPREQLNYLYFDFHEQCAKNTDPLVELVDTTIYSDFIEKMGIFVISNNVVLK
jgi:hypothetical protein